MRVSRQSRRIAVLWLSGIAVFCLAACSGGGDDAQDDARATPSATSAPAAGSESPSVSPEKDGAGSSAASVADIENAEDLAKVMTTAMRAAGSVKLKLVAQSTAGAGGSVAGVGSMVIGDDPAMQLAASTAGQQVKLRLVDGAVYISPGQQIMGKSWIKLDPQGEDAISKTFAGLVSSLGTAADVSEAVTGFDQASSFKSIGAKMVGGEQTQGFVVVLDEAGLRAAVPEQYEGLVGAQLDGAKATYTIYLNDKGEPRQVTTQTTFKSGSTKQVVDYSDWGAKVTVAPPPDSQVIDSSELG